MEIKCAVCGKLVTKNSAPQKYCSKACSNKHRAEVRKEERRLGKTKKPKYIPGGTEKEIVRINRLAREMGLSYGQYVVQFGGGANVRGKEVPATSQTV